MEYLFVWWALSGVLAHIIFRVLNPKTELMADVDWMMVALAYIGGPLSAIGFFVGHLVWNAMERKK